MKRIKNDGLKFAVSRRYKDKSREVDIVTFYETREDAERSLREEDDEDCGYAYVLRVESVWEKE